MWRVLRPGGQVLAVTPFFAPFHGYPSHFQNFTLTGHRRLFEQVHFDVAASGVCVGPAFAMAEHLIAFVRMVGGRSRWLHLLADLLALSLLPTRRLDAWLSRRPWAHMVAASTYVHARKP